LFNFSNLSAILMFIEYGHSRCPAGGTK